MADIYQTEKEQVRPLSHPSPSIHQIPSLDEESGTIGAWRSPYEYLRKRRCALWCCGCSGAAVVILGVIILILAFTVFKIKDPELTMNSLYVNSLFIPGIGTQDHFVSVNASLAADISIKNPNAASFKYRNSTTEFYYGDQTVGVAYAPEGRVAARRTVRMNVTVEVLADRVVLDTNATDAGILGDGIDMRSYTDISGRVDVIGIYKRDLDILLNCTFTLNILERSLGNKLCRAHVK